MKTLITALSFLSLTTATSLYAADFKLQNIRVGGVGCPSELTTIVLAPDASSASLIFSQFESRVPVLNAGPKVSRNISTLNCNIFLDVKVPAGVKLDSLEVAYDMRGFTTLDRGVQGSFKSFLVSKSGLGTESVGSRNPETLAERLWFNTFSNQEEDFTVSALKTIAIPSQCARGSATDVVSIRLQHTLSSQILAGFETQSQGSITMDTSDIKGGLRLRALTSSCGSNSQPQTQPGRNCRLVRVDGRTQQVCI
ncbi:DUF4360 domain-containing protein [Bacteriovorax stolpii]|uniref:DUF4360 domain-containing protein n=1 Tax=Bacteriovorax stolpii TaxID=960 RepID=UPI00163C6BCF|nr:DUF4360 domain-containing protein [Bacteriovorax stolpii]